MFAVAADSHFINFLLCVFLVCIYKRETIVVQGTDVSFTKSLVDFVACTLNEI